MLDIFSGLLSFTIINGSGYKLVLSVTGGEAPCIEASLGRSLLSIDPRQMTAASDLEYRRGLRLRPMW